MTAPGITSGDWYTMGGRQPQIASEADPKGRTLALVYDLADPNETAANARAIAALPKLLKALDNLVGVGAQFSTVCDRAEHDSDGPCIFCEARAAIEEAGA